jgi:type I restriction enzyme, S subunit
MLPDGWVLTSVGEIYDIVGGGTPSTSIEEYWKGDIAWVTSADIYGLKDIRPRKRITKSAIENSATNLVPEGSLIVVTRVGLGKVALTKIPLCFSQD